VGCKTPPSQEAFAFAVAFAVAFAFAVAGCRVAHPWQPHREGWDANRHPTTKPFAFAVAVAVAVDVAVALAIAFAFAPLPLGLERGF